MPLLYREQLPQLFADNGLPPLKLSYLNKLTSLGEGPPVETIDKGRRKYNPQVCISWLTDRIEAQKLAACARSERNRQFHQKMKKRREQAAHENQQQHNP